VATVRGRNSIKAPTAGIKARLSTMKAARNVIQNVIIRPDDFFKDEVFVPWASDAPPELGVRVDFLILNLLIIIIWMK
jgi:hypothetical protein